MTSPIKKAGFAQGLYEVSSTKKEELGTLRITQDGRKFRYARAGASALGASKCGIAAAIAADVTNEACAAAHAIGERVFQETITAAAAAYAADFFAGGFLQINDGTGEGHQYLIESSTAVDAGGTSISLALADPLRVALVAADSEFTLVHSPWMGVTESDVEENLPVGIAPVAVPANYYYWAQTGGCAGALVSGTPAVGSVLTLGAVAGALAAIATPLDVDVCYEVGKLYGRAGVDGETASVFLTLD